MYKQGALNSGPSGIKQVKYTLTQNYKRHLHSQANSRRGSMDSPLSMAAQKRHPNTLLRFDKTTIWHIDAGVSPIAQAIPQMAQFRCRQVRKWLQTKAMVLQTFLELPGVAEDAVVPAKFWHYRFLHRALQRWFSLRHLPPSQSTCRSLHGLLKCRLPAPAGAPSRVKVCKSGGLDLAGVLATKLIPSTPLHMDSFDNKGQQQVALNYLHQENR